MKCIRCDKSLEQWAGEKRVAHPLDGLAFQTCGHYGSGAFDPMNGSIIEVVLCDHCLRRAVADGGFVFGDTHEVNQ